MQKDVRDAAEFFSDSAERQANERIAKIKQAHGKDVIVESVPAVPDAPRADPQKITGPGTSRRGRRGVAERQDGAAGQPSSVSRRRTSW